MRDGEGQNAASDDQLITMLRASLQALTTVFKAADRSAREIDDILCNAILAIERSGRLSRAEREEKAPSWVAVPLAPTIALLDSMGMRYRHDFGLLSESEKASVRTMMSQLYEEATGQGFYKLGQGEASATGAGKIVNAQDARG